jgi:hypothetical protein
MAESNRQSKNKRGGLEQHPLVGKLIPDPDQPAEARVLSGFVGTSTREGHVRLYLNLELSSYVEIAEDDVLHAEAPSPDDPMGMSVLWVRRGAPMASTQLMPEQTQAELLTGMLTEGVQFDPQSEGFAPMTTLPCRVSMAVCPRPSGRCTSIPETGRCSARCTARC